jgi:hypothetical protein
MTLRRMRGGRLRAATSVLGVLLATAATVVTTGSAAHAATCTDRVGRSIQISSGSTNPASANISFAPECSDGRSSVWGQVFDTRCDSMRASLSYTIFDLRNGSYREIHAGTAQALNGCGTSATFRHYRNSPGSTGWRLSVRLSAHNGNPLDAPYSRDFNYYG